MVAKEHLLTSVQMANFVADGFLRFDELVPDHLNAPPWPRWRAMRSNP